MKTPEQIQQIKQDKADNKESRRSFAWLIQMAKRKGALVEVEINGKIIFKLQN